LNYRPNALAADLRRGTSRMVGVHMASVGYPILDRKVAALERGLREAGLYPFLCHAVDSDAEQSFFQECVGRRVCGVVLMTRPRPGSRDELSRLRDEGAVVVLAEPVAELELPYVTVDYGAGAEAAVRHLLSLGHRRIAVIEGFGGQSWRDFCEGYRRGLASGGVPFDPEFVWALEPGSSNFERGERTAERWFSRLATATALMTTDDEVAIGVLRALKRGGRRVPEDVAVIGFDDLPVAAYAEVPLTTLAQPAEEMGVQLAQLFVEGLKDAQQIAGRQIVLPLRLVVRESCGARRGRK
jgi:DNA-binding LacI/PurR family transcriptional regulator